MNINENNNKIALTREMGLKQRKLKINWKKLIINSSIIILIAIIVISLIFLVGIAKKAL